MTLFLNVCQSETYRSSAERNGYFASICIYSKYIYTHIYIYTVLFSPRVMDFLNQHMTEPHSTHSNPSDLSSVFILCLPAKFVQKSRAMQRGTLSLGHITILPTTIPKDCHKNTHCVSLAQSISIALTSQQIIELGQLCYPFGTQLFKHP